MSTKEQKNYIIPDDLAETFSYWCKRKDVSMSQQIRKMMRKFIIKASLEAEDEKTKDKQRKKQKELFEECRTTQEEQSSSNAWGLQAVEGMDEEVKHLESLEVIDAML